MMNDEISMYPEPEPDCETCEHTIAHDKLVDKTIKKYYQAIIDVHEKHCSLSCKDFIDCRLESREPCEYVVGYIKHLEENDDA